MHRRTHCSKIVNNQLLFACKDGYPQNSDIDEYIIDSVTSNTYRNRFIIIIFITARRNSFILRNIIRKMQKNNTRKIF